MNRRDDRFHATLAEWPLQSIIFAAFIVGVTVFLGATLADVAYGVRPDLFEMVEVSHVQ